MSLPLAFRRPDLARRMLDNALGIPVLSDANGLFLAAPRGTGKSTFLRDDLVPEARSRGMAAVHADLWSDVARDPADLLTEALGAALRGMGGEATRARPGRRRPIGIEGGACPRGVTIADTVAELCRRTGRPTLLVVDEAQRLPSTGRGGDMTFALKSARDALNIGAPSTPHGNVGLALVMIGSDRDGLSSIVRGHRQPFYCNRVDDFPPLGEGYARAYAAHANMGRPEGTRLDPAEVSAAFAAVGRRPRSLRRPFRRTWAAGTTPDGRRRRSSTAPPRRWMRPGPTRTRTHRVPPPPEAARTRRCRFPSRGPSCPTARPPRIRPWQGTSP